jgi:serine/threonine protein kinase
MLPRPPRLVGGPSVDITFDTSTDFELDVGALVFGDAPLLIGAGNFASIHKALYRGEAVAVKVQPYLLVDAAVGAAELPDMDSEEACQLRELAILRSLRHDNLVRFVGAARVPASTLPAKVWSATTNTRGAVANDGMEPTTGALPAAQDALLIVTEWMEGGDLLQLLRRDDSDRPLGWLQRVRLLRGVAAGLAFLHARGVIHRDIKTANMLVDADFGACKLCDHGLARPGATQERRERLIAALTPKPQPSRGLGTTACTDGADAAAARRKRHSRALSGRAGQRLSICGTDQYMAPEMLYGQTEYTEKVDVFGFGLVIVELVLRHMIPVLYNPAGSQGSRAGSPSTVLTRKPHDGFSLNYEGLRGRIAERKPGCPASLTELAMQCLAHEPEDRPSAPEALEWLDALASDMEAGFVVVQSRLRALLAHHPAAAIDTASAVVIAVPPTAAEHSDHPAGGSDDEGKAARASRACCSRCL